MLQRIVKQKFYNNDILFYEWNLNSEHASLTFVNDQLVLSHFPYNKRKLIIFIITFYYLFLV